MSGRSTSVMSRPPQSQVVTVKQFNNFWPLILKQRKRPMKSIDNLIAFRFVERFPKLSLLASFSALTSVWLCTGILFVVGYDIAPIDLNFFPIQIRSSIWYRRATSVMLWSKNTSKFVLPGVTSVSKTWLDAFKIDLYYKVEGNILTYDNLIRMKKIEDEIKSVKGFNTNFHTPISFFQLFKFDSNTNFTNEDVTRKLAAFSYLKPEEAEKFKSQVFPISFNVDVSKGYSYSSLLRTVLIPNYNGEHFIKDVFRTLLKKQWLAAKSDGSYEFAYFNLLLYYKDLADQASRDTFYVLGSFFFIMFVLMLHTRSVVMSIAAIFGIVSSVLGANLIYRIVLDQRYIGIFHCISLFIILGIGADDVFVLFDAWRDTFDSRSPQPSSLCHRLSQVFRHAAKPMFITSLTSSAAFFVNGICKVPIVSTFGIFTGLVVIVNYLMVITFLPCVLVNQLLFYRWLETRNLLVVCIPKWMRVTNESKRQQRWMATFFGYYFFNCITRKLISIISLCLFLLISGLAIWQASKLRPSKAALSELFAKGTNYYWANEFEKEFTRTRFLTVDIVWGIDGINDTMCHKHDFDCRGTVKLKDYLFNLNYYFTQNALFNFCQRLNHDAKLAKRLRILRKNGRNLVNCFIYDMQRDMLYQRNKRKYSCEDGGLLDLTLPIAEEKSGRLTICKSSDYQSKEFEKYIHRYTFGHSFEKALQYWLLTSTPGKNIPSDSKVSTYSCMDVSTIWIPGIKKLPIPFRTKLFIGSDLKVVIVRVKLNLTSTSDIYTSGGLLRDEWESFIDENNLRFPLGLRGAFQCMSEPFPKSPINIWEWYDIQERLWNNARNGMLLGIFAVALPILLLTTKSILLTVVSVFCLICITACLIAMAYLAGWSLGITESINLAMVTGLSIDYIVHFVEAYSRSKEMTRVGKVQDMLMQMGGAVTSGMITTVGATSFLFPASVNVFIQFGAFMAATIGCAFCYTLFFLTPFLVLWGPA